MLRVRLLVLVLATIVAVYGQVPTTESCPHVNALQNFDVNKYMGKWYEHAKYFAIFEIGGKCVTARYSFKDGKVEVINGMINKLTENNSSIVGYATPVSETEAKLEVVFPSLPVQVKAPYWVIGTDYDSYAVVWSCTEIATISLRYLWILTRERHPSQETVAKAYEAVDAQKIPRGPISKTNQNDCPSNY